MAELLLELLSEEIPARMQARAAEDLRRLVTDRLKEAGLAYTEARAYATPRRLALVVDGLPEKQPDVTEEKKGPKVGAPEQAVQGFMKANGLASIDQAEQRKTDKGEFYFAVRHVKGRPTGDVLSGIIEAVLRAFGWPKSMRWANNEFRWIRPLHKILCVFRGQVVNVVFGQVWSGKGQVDAEGSESVGRLSYAFSITNGNVTNTTIGHRFLAPEPFEVSCFADYEKKLRKARVILEREERKAPGPFGRGGRNDRVAAGADGGRRRGLYGPAARGADHGHAPPSEILLDPGCRRQAGRPLPLRRQHAGT
jgi:glycyl-tRNA synthetase beta chain